MTAFLTVEAYHLSSLSSCTLLPCFDRLPPFRYARGDPAVKAPMAIGCTSRSSPNIVSSFPARVDGDAFFLFLISNNHIVYATRTCSPCKSLCCHPSSHLLLPRSGQPSDTPLLQGLRIHSMATSHDRVMLLDRSLNRYSSLLWCSQFAHGLLPSSPT